MAGRPPDVTDEEILNFFEESKEDQLTTSDIKNKLGYSQSGTYRRLKKLEQEGKLESRKTGNNTLWKISNKNNNENN